MQDIQFVIEHMKNAYKLEVVPCLIPKNNFQYYKGKFYLFILNNISEKLFSLLKDKISPIKFLETRPDRSIWLNKKNSKIEIKIKPIPVYLWQYSDNESGSFKLLDVNYKVTIQPNDVGFLLNYINGIEQVDYYFSKVNDLKSELRNYKINSIINV